LFCYIQKAEIATKRGRQQLEGETATGEGETAAGEEETASGEEETATKRGRQQL